MNSVSFLTDGKSVAEHEMQVAREAYLACKPGTKERDDALEVYTKAQDEYLAALEGKKAG